MKQKVGKLNKQKPASIKDKIKAKIPVKALRKLGINHTISTRLLERAKSEIANAKDLKEMGLSPMEINANDILDEFSEPIDPRKIKSYHELRSLTPTETNINNGTFPLLADEIMLNIFKWLSKTTLIVCALVCKQWNRLVYDETLWRRIDLGERIIYTGVMDRVLNRGVQVLRLTKSTFHSPIFVNGLETSQIQYLDLSAAVIDCESLEQVLNTCRQLRKLSLESCCINNKICSLIGANQHLTTLNLALCEGVSKKGLSYILRGCFVLRDLNLAWTELDYQTLLRVANELPISIKTLNISGFRDVLTNNVVLDIIERCKQIEEIDLSDSSCITSALLDHFQQLKHLNFIAVSRCYGLSDSHHFYCLKTVLNLRNLVIFGLFDENVIQQLQLNLPNVLINQNILSEIARPTTGHRHTSLWGLGMRV